MKPIYEDAHDVHIRSNLVYAKAADKKLYYEAAYTNQVTQADLEDAFKKGTLLIVDGSKYLKAVELVGNIVKTLCLTGNPTEDFDAAETYDVGDCVLKDGVGYKCTTQVSVAAAWDATDWTAIDTTNFIEWTAKAAD
jgi:hypothetical protein